MALLPDPDTLLAVADRITRHATAIRRHAQVLAAAVGHTTWHGAAARAFAGEALEVCVSLRRSADRLDDAASALRRHAARVRAVLHELARAANDAAHVGLDANRVVADVVVDPDHLGRDTRHLVGSAVQATGDAVHAAGHVLHAVGI